LHRIAEVMCQEGIRARTASRRMRVPLSNVPVQQDACFDLLLSDLYRWQAALQVPLIDLLVDPECSLSTPVQLRANLLKVMKSVRSIEENAKQETIKTLAKNMAQQLVEMMPELQGVPAWPVVGQRRTIDELGAAAQRRLPDDLFENSQPGCWEPDSAAGQP